MLATRGNATHGLDCRSDCTSPATGVAGSACLAQTVAHRQVPTLLPLYCVFGRGDCRTTLRHGPSGPFLCSVLEYRDHLRPPGVAGDRGSMLASVENLL